MENDDEVIGRIGAFGELSAEDVDVLKAIAGPLRHFKRGDLLRHEGDAQPKMYLLVRGWTDSSILMPDGERQSIKVHMPGDLLGMPGLAFKKSPDTIRALTEVVVSIIEPSSLGDLFMMSPRIAAMLFLVSQEERVFLMDRLASIGRTSAIGRIAMLILQLDARITRTRGQQIEGFFAPLSQGQIGDLTGLTAVHVNRTLQKLAQLQVCTWRDRVVTIADRPGLRDLAGIPARELATDHFWLGDAPRHLRMQAAT